MLIGRRGAFALTLLVVTALGLQLVSQLSAPPGMHSVEELFNAAHALIIRDGGWDLAAPFRYQAECGGCAVVAGMGSVLFSFVEPSVGAWRSIGLLFFAVALTAGLVTGFRAARLPGALTVAFVFAAAPPAYQHLSMVVHGNHTEGGAWLLVEVALAVAAATARTPLRRGLAFFCLLLLVGGGVPFLLSLQLGLALPFVVILLARAALWERLALWPGLMLLGTAGGLLPYRALIGSMASKGSGSHESGELVLSFSYASRNLGTLLEPMQLRGIWGSADGPLQGRLGWVSFVAVALLVGYGLIRTGVQLWKVRRLSEECRAFLLPAVTVGMFVALYLVFERQIGSGGGPPSPDQIRYLGFIYPTLLCTAALGAAMMWVRGGVGRFVMPFLLLALTLPGLADRGHDLGRLGSEGTHGLQRYAPASSYTCDMVERMGVPIERAPRIGRLDLAGMTRGRELVRGGSAALDTSLRVTDEATTFGVLRELMPAGFDANRPLPEYLAPLRPSAAEEGVDPLLEALGVGRPREGGANAFDELLLRKLWTFQRLSLQFAHQRWSQESFDEAVTPEQDPFGLLLRSVGAGFGLEPAPMARRTGTNLVLPAGAATLWGKVRPPAEQLPGWSWSWGWGLGAQLGLHNGSGVEHIDLSVGIPKTAEPSGDLRAIEEVLGRGFAAGYLYGNWLDWVGPRWSSPPQVTVALQELPAEEG